MTRLVTQKSIALQNARGVRAHLNNKALTWHGWSGESYRQHWQAARKFMVRFKPVLVKGKKGTFVIDIGAMSHETPYGIRLAVSSNKSLVNLIALRLDFHEKTVLVKAVQGEPARTLNEAYVAPTNLPALREFEARAGKKAANYLFGELKAQAGRMGYTTIRLTKPEELPNYKDPFIGEEWKKKLAKEIKKIAASAGTSESAAVVMARAEAEIRKQIREKMRKLYYGLAETEKLSDKETYWEVQL